MGGAMTEDEEDADDFGSDEWYWDHPTSVWSMWSGLPNPPSGAIDRKKLLLAVAVVRRCERLMLDSRSRAVIPLSEAYADGLLSSRELNTAHRAAYDAEDQYFPTRAASWAASAGRKLWHCWSDLGEAAGAACAALAYDLAPDENSPAHAAAMAAEEAHVIALIRDVYGNPFRPVPFSAAWRTDTTVSLARTMYDAREFSAMPILADALQDAGCDSEDIFAHCRDAKPVHVRGCWVCDLVLGKS